MNANCAVRVGMASQDLFGEFVIEGGVRKEFFGG
jgi:hypothetical protein